MRLLLPVIILSRLLAGHNPRADHSQINFRRDNPCAITTLDNCADNVGYDCTEGDINDNPIEVGQDICCWDSFDEQGDQVGSGMVECGVDGLFFAVSCEPPLKCKTDFNSCTHQCL